MQTTQTNTDTAREAATAFYGSDQIDVNEDSQVRPVEDGYWVEAFVWVSNEDVDDYRAHEGGGA